MADNHIKLYKKLALKALRKKNYRRNLDILLTHKVRANKIKLHFDNWKELVKDAFEEFQDRKVASMLWKQHMFFRLKDGAKKYGQEVGVVFNLRRKQ